MKATFISMALFALMALNGYAAESLTLEEAMTTALKSHPQVIMAQEAVNGAEARTGIVHANYYPQISIIADWSRGRFFLTPLESIKQTEVQTNALYLQQTIYDLVGLPEQLNQHAGIAPPL